MAPAVNEDAAIPLAGRRVAVTAAGTTATHIAAALTALGATPSMTPCVAIEPVSGSDATALRCALDAIARYDWVVLTSTNAAGAVAAALWTRERGVPRIAAVGSSTAGALRAGGITDVVIPETALATGIPRVMGDVAGRRILVPRGDLAAPDLPRALRAAGAIVDEPLAYRTVPGPGCAELGAAIRARNLDAVTFASGSAVRYFVGACGGPGRHALAAGDATRTACIGPSTAAVAREMGVVVHAVAATHDAAGLARAVVDALRGSEAARAQEERYDRLS